MATPDALNLQHYGIASSAQVFGPSVTDPVMNGKAPGGIAVDTAQPGANDVDHAVASSLDPVRASSPVTLLVVMVAIYVVLNRGAKRRGT